jgi:hypothetical protein
VAISTRLSSRINHAALLWFCRWYYRAEATAPWREEGKFALRLAELDDLIRKLALARQWLVK